MPRFYSSAVATLRLLCLAVLFQAIVFGLTPSTVSLTASPNPSNYGQAVTLTATVTAGATGKVTFYDGVTILGIGTISGTEAATTTVMLASGSRSLRAYYGGDATYASSSSAPLPQSVVAGTSLGFHHPVVPKPEVGGTAMAVGDFNGDGKLDFVSTGNANAVYVYLGNGDGTVRYGASYATGSYSGSVAVGDFNGDGKMDLAVANYASANVSILLGNGDGTFQAAVNYPAGPSPGALAVGDINGDGIADLLVPGYTGNGELYVMLGNGDGTFRAPTSYPVGSYPSSVAIGDFNGDGKPDAVVATTSGVSVLLGNGDGTFAAAVNYPVVAGCTSVLVRDLNGDGKTDLVVLGNAEANVLLGNGDGTFGTAVTYPAGLDVTGLAVEDFNGDGKPDIAAAIPDEGMGVLLGNGDGTFQSAVYYADNTNSAVVVAGDFNGDGKIDLLACQGCVVLLGGAAPDLAIAVSHGGGLTQGQQGAEYIVTVSNVGDWASVGAVNVAIALPAGLTAANFSGNGWTCTVATLACTRTDSVAVGASYPAINLKINVASGLTGNVVTTFTVSGGGDQSPPNNSVTDTTLARTPTSTTLTSSPNPSVLGQAVTLTATVTAGAAGNVAFYDGLTYLGSATLSAGQSVLTTTLLLPGVRSLSAIYTGDSNYGPSTPAARAQTVTPAPENGTQPPASYSYTTGVWPNWIVTGDFNRDGKADLINANTGTNAGTISVLLGNGDGTFRPAVNYNDGGSGGISSPPSNVAAAGDFNNDGNPDVAVATYSGIFLLAGNGDGTFRTAVAVETAASASALIAADFNGDGNQDLVALSNGNIVLYPGNGDGTFQPPVALTPSGALYSSLSVADMNGDGKPDLLALSSDDSTFAIFLNNGDGTFQLSTNLSVSIVGVCAIAVGDFDGDGKQDVAMTFWNGIALFLGNGDGTLKPAIHSDLGNAPGSFAIAGDFNGDGKLDLAVAADGGNYVYLVFGNGDGTFQPSVTIVTGGNVNSVVLGDFNGDGRADFAAATNAGTEVFLGGQFSGLGISSVHSGNFTVGQTGTYQITVENPYFASSNGTVTVTDTLPAGLTATAIGSTDFSWTCTLSTLTCTNNNYLYSGATLPPITVTVNVAASLPPSVVTNHVSVTSSAGTRAATDPTTIVLPSTTSLTVSPTPSTLLQTVTMTATVTGGLTGIVVFSDGGNTLGTATLTGGQASFSTRLLQSGLRNLAATYSGDSTHAPSISAVKYQAVNASPARGLIAGGTYSTGAAPMSIAAGDFNLDGKADLVTANSTANTISVLLGNGDGTFGANTDYAVGTQPMAVVVADFNNDGKPDIAVANQNSNTVSILLGNGNGTFQPAFSVAAGTVPSSLAVADINSDGKPDLVVLSATTEDFTFLLGIGDGTFQPAVPFTGDRASIFAIGDFNNDGKADIVGSFAGVEVELGNGDGTFQSMLYTNVSAFSLAVGDLNADGKADLVVGGPDGVGVLLGNGDGTFQAPVQYIGNEPASVLLADVNGDGKLDVVAVNYVNTFTVYLGNGDGTLQAPSSYAAGNSPQAAVAGDFNGDGRTDLAVVNSGSTGLEVLLGSLAPVFSVTSSTMGPFAFGQTGAFTLSLTNNGPGVTNGTVTVADTLPPGLTATAIAGTGWTCVLATITCTRSDSLAVGATYPAITLTVNVAANTLTTVTNTVSASGGGAVPALGTDRVSIVAGITIQTNPAGLQFSVNGGATQTAPQTLPLWPGSYTISVSSTQAGSPGTQYVFTGWSDSGAASHTITVTAASVTYTASFKTQYQLTTTALPSVGGRVSLPLSTYFDAGTIVPVTAMPTTPYAFSSWSGDATGTASTVSVTMNGAKSVAANFAVPGFTCDIDGNGVVNSTDVQLILKEALGTALPVHDLNGDGVVNIVDVQIAIDAALGLGCTAR